MLSDAVDVHVRPLINVLLEIPRCDVERPQPDLVAAVVRTNDDVAWLCFVLAMYIKRLKTVFVLSEEFVPTLCAFFTVIPDILLIPKIESSCKPGIAVGVFFMSA